MSKGFRRYLFILFVLAFLVMASIIIPYAFGYKLDSAGFKLQKTGMFVIDTDPKGATIFLNDQEQKNTFLNFSNSKNESTLTPAKLSHIAPGTYRVRLELDGYWPWEKELIVRPSETTYLEDVKFFKRNLPELMFNSKLPEIKSSVVSPDRNYIAYNTASEVKLFNFKTQENKSLIKEKTDQLTWSNNGDWLFTDSSAINIKDGSVINLNKLAKQTISLPFWTTASDNQICYQNKLGVYQLDLLTGVSKLLIKKNNATDVIKNCLIKNNYSYIIKEAKNQSQLIITKPGDEKELGVIKLPRMADYQFININNKWLNLFDTNSRKLTLIDTNLPWTSNYSLKNIDNQVKVNYWIDDHRLLYANDFEIWIYDTSTDKNTLLTRASHPINNVFWHPSNNYIVFATDSSISTLELDDRERHNITTLLQMPITGQAEMDAGGTSINFFGQIGQQEGYWRIEL